MLYIVNNLRDSFTPETPRRAAWTKIFPPNSRSVVMDKRDLSAIFRERLKLLLTRSDLNQSAFAGAVGIDRSALSQLMSGASTRLPRAETLLNIAAEFKVSLDWLLGLSQDEGVTGEIRESLEIEEAPDGF